MLQFFAYFPEHYSFTAKFTSTSAHYRSSKNGTIDVCPTKTNTFVRKYKKKQVTAPVAACLHGVHSFDTVQLID
jgi:hypothetical protein